jgi:hypothetical protein
MNSISAGKDTGNVSGVVAFIEDEESCTVF